jgi:hypothetical protein
MILILTVAAGLMGSSSSERGSWIIEMDSKLAIRGSTNINEFVCKIDYYCGSDTLQFVRNPKDQRLIFSSNRMTIPIKDFDCGARQISNDFFKTLKSDTYPELSIQFRTLDNPFNQKISAGVVDITLAGVTTTYTVCYRVRIDKNIVYLNGVHPVNFSDFKLEAPKKLQGLIKVKEVLNVEFNLVLKEV